MLGLGNAGTDKNVAALWRLAATGQGIRSAGTTTRGLGSPVETNTAVLWWANSRV